MGADFSARKALDMTSRAFRFGLIGRLSWPVALLQLTVFAANRRAAQAKAIDQAKRVFPAFDWEAIAL